jgi:hypothetical protein
VPGGCFVIENYVPELRRLPPGETTYLFAATPTHVGYEQYDVANQLAVSHHQWVIDGDLKQSRRSTGASARENWTSWPT